MNLDNLPLGENVPHDINVIFEIPSHGSPVKYEVDKDSGTLTVDRFMGTAMFYPSNYGFMPHTLADDGDPVDVLVVTPANGLRWKAGWVLKKPSRKFSTVFSVITVSDGISN